MSHPPRLIKQIADLITDLCTSFVKITITISIRVEYRAAAWLVFTQELVNLKSQR